MSEELVKKVEVCLEDVKYLVEAFVKWKEVETIFYNVLTKRRRWVCKCEETGEVKEFEYPLAESSEVIRILKYPITVHKVLELFYEIPLPHSRLFYLIFGRGRKYWLEVESDRRLVFPSIDFEISVDTFSKGRICFEEIKIITEPKVKFELEEKPPEMSWTEYAIQIVRKMYSLKVDYEEVEEERKEFKCRTCLEPYETLIIIDGLYKFRELCRRIARINVPQRFRSIVECLTMMVK